MLFRAILLSRISISLVHRIEIIKIEKKNRKTIISFLRILSTKKIKKFAENMRPPVLPQPQIFYFVDIVN